MKYRTRGTTKPLPNPTPSAEVIQVLLNLGLPGHMKHDVLGVSFDLVNGVARVALVDRSTGRSVGNIHAFDIMYTEFSL